MPFDDFLAPIKRQLGETDVSDYLPVATIDLGEVPCNWKLLMENFIEPYHVQFVHKTTTEQPLEDHYTVIDEHCLGSAVELSEEQVANAQSRNTRGDLALPDAVSEFRHGHLSARPDGSAPE